MRTVKDQCFVRPLFVLLALLCLVGACGEKGRVTGPEGGLPLTPARGHLLLTPTPTPYIITHLRSVRSYVAASIDERIYVADVIVRATLKSVVHAPKEIDHGAGIASTYEAQHVLTFTVHETLKGTASKSLDVAVPFGPDYTFSAKHDADTAASALLDERTTEWDDRDAVIFLSMTSYKSLTATPPAASASSPSTTTSYEFTYTGGALYGEYSVDTLNRAWLPKSTLTSQEAPQPGTSSPVATPESVSNDYIMAPQEVEDGNPTTISLKALRKKINEMAAALEAGKNIDGFESCYVSSVSRERTYRGIEARDGKPWSPWQSEKAIKSGIGAGQAVKKSSFGSAERSYHEFSLSGTDAALFTAQIDDDDKNAVNGYTHVTANVRPLASGQYRFYWHMRHEDHFPCNFRPDNNYVEFAVTAVAPAGTLHEAFFDPVAISAAVGADAANGVLKPASFAIDDTTNTTLDSIAWESPRATIKVSPAALPANHHVDFIGLDGKFALRLDIDDATKSVDGDDTTFTWGVCKQPWKADDQLMLRIRDTGKSLRGATNDVACDGTPIPTVTPVLTPTPIPSPTPAPTATPAAGAPKATLLASGGMRLDWDATTGATQYKIAYRLPGSSAAWEEPRVTIEISPAALPANHNVDFIALDGSVALRLDIDDATKSVNGDDTTFTWGVCAQPWKADDQLMLRISKSSADLTGATNDTACDGTPIPTLTPVPSPTPIPSPTPAPAVGAPKATPLASGGIRLTWGATTGATQYKIAFRTPGSSSAWTEVGGSTITTNTQDLAIYNCGITFEFRVRPKLGNGNWGNWSPASSPYTKPCP